MGTLKSNLRKISLFSGATTRVINIGRYLLPLLLLSLQNVEPKSLFPMSTNDNGQGTSETDITEIPESTTITTTTTTPSIIETKLAITTQVIWELTKKQSESHKFSMSSNPKVNGYRIAIHLKACDFNSEDGEYIEIITENGIDQWNCSNKRLMNSQLQSSSNFLDDYKSKEIKIGSVTDKHSGDLYVNINNVKDNLDHVTFIPHFNFNKKRKKTGEDTKYWKEQVKATIIINLYHDTGNGCPPDHFDCHQPLCPPTCCSDVAAGGSGSNHRSSSSAPITKDVFTTAYWSKMSSSQIYRCIPKEFACNDQPNCGMFKNIDEMNEICHPERFCSCESVCLTWNYVLTSLAIAVLFIITPTAIVFALFHRRNVALERARLIRLAQMRMTDMRGDFTRDDPVNDRPPTYDEVYDIKEPPPCFCQALAMQKEYDSRQEQGNSPDANLNDNENQDQVQNDDEISQENGTLSYQNSGFQCSCANLSREGDEETAEDIPPSYNELRRRETGTEEGEDQIPKQDESNSNSNANLNNRNMFSAEFENIDLDKEEDA